MQRPTARARWGLAALGAVLVLGLLYLHMTTRGPDRQAARTAAALPWQIEVEADGTSRVFGIHLGHTTLGEARALLGPRMELAVIAEPGEPGMLEGYYAEISPGGLTGKLVLGVDIERPQLRQIKRGAAEVSRLATGALKHIPAPRDLDRIRTLPVSSVTYIPVAQLDPELIQRLFGPPGDRIPGDAGRIHFLYPERGLDLIVDPEGKEVLQYVAPREFHRLRAPLERTAKE